MFRASALIAEGLDVVQVAEQTGHSNPSITLRVYADLFHRARNAKRTQRAIDSTFGTALESDGGDRRRQKVGASESNVASLAVSSRGGNS